MVSQWMGRAFGNKGRFGHKREGPVFFTSFVIFVFEHFMAHKQVRFLSMNLYVSLYIYIYILYMCELLFIYSWGISPWSRQAP